jgi:hypothetical protein
MRRGLGVCLVAIFLLAMMHAVLAANLKEQLEDRAVAQTLQLKDLNQDWLRFTLGDTGTGSIADIYSAFLGGGASANVYFTKGETTSFAGATYLIAYQIQKKAPDIARLIRSGPSTTPKPEKLTPVTTLTLSLVNLRNVNTLNEMRIFDLQAELAQAQQTTSAMESAIETEESTDTEQRSVANLKQLALAIQLYASDWDEKLPLKMDNPEELKQTLMPYTRNEQLFINPIDQKPYLANSILAGKKLAHIAYPGQMVLFYEETPAPDETRGVAFLDGSAKRINESEWPRLKKASKIE